MNTTNYCNHLLYASFFSSFCHDSTPNGDYCDFNGDFSNGYVRCARVCWSVAVAVFVLLGAWLLDCVAFGEIATHRIGNDRMRRVLHYRRDRSRGIRMPAIRFQFGNRPFSFGEFNIVFDWPQTRAYSICHFSSILWPCSPFRWATHLLSSSINKSFCSCVALACAVALGRAHKSNKLNMGTSHSRAHLTRDFHVNKLQ